MVFNKSGILAVLLIVIVADSVCAENAKEVVVSSAKELKGIKAKKITWKKDGAKMVRIPWISSYTKYGDPNFEPFYMDTTEVTVGQFKKFLKDTGYEPEEPIDWAELYKYSPTDKHPMIMVNWHHATAYAKWASKRLPTNDEWEFAARGGLVNKSFPWGDGIEIAQSYAHSKVSFMKDNNSKWDLMTAPVGSFKPNGYGLYDMAGNVWEWCDAWHIFSKQTARVFRGGSWREGLFVLDYLHEENFWHAKGSPLTYRDNLGFRCVVGSK